MTGDWRLEINLQSLIPNLCSPKQKATDRNVSVACAFCSALGSYPSGKRHASANHDALAKKERILLARVAEAIHCFLLMNQVDNRLAQVGAQIN